MSQVALWLDRTWRSGILRLVVTLCPPSAPSSSSSCFLSVSLQTSVRFKTAIATPTGPRPHRLLVDPTNDALGKPESTQHQRLSTSVMPSLSSLLPLSLLASLVLGTPISAPPERSIALHNGFLRSYGFAEADAEAGPSGTLVTPVGSTTYYNAGGTGEVEVEYQGVTDGDSNDQSGRTLGINLVLVPRNVGSLDDRTNVTVRPSLLPRSGL